MTTINKLNYDCLAHIFEFFGPKEWLVFSKVCKKWNTAMNFLWKDIFRIIYVTNWDFRSIRNDTQLILYREIIDIIKKTGLKLKHVALLIDEKYLIDKDEKVLCFFGTHRYCVSTKFKWKNLVQVIVNATHSLESLTIERTIEKNEISILKKLFEKNKSLMTLKMCTENFGLENSNFLIKLPNTLENISLKFNYHNTQNYDHMILLLDKQLKLTHIHIKSPYLPDVLFPILLKHKKNIKSLHLECTRHYTGSLPGRRKKTLLQEQLKEISKFENLEKISLTLSMSVSEDVVLKILQDCPKINEIKLDCDATHKVLTSVMSIPKLETLWLEGGTEIMELPCPMEMKHLKCIKLCLNNSFNFESLRFAIDQMPNLSHLIITIDSATEFCKQFLITVIISFLSRDMYVVILGYNYESASDVEHAEIAGGGKFVPQLEFYRNDAAFKSGNLCFKMSFEQHCIDHFLTAYFNDRDLLLNCKAFKREGGVCEPLFENSLNSHS